MSHISGARYTTPIRQFRQVRAYEEIADIENESFILPITNRTAFLFLYIRSRARAVADIFIE